MESQELLKQAKKRVAAKRGFYWHLIISVLVAAFLMFLNLITSPGYLWFLIPTAALLLSVGIHWLGVFGLGKNWEKQQLEKEISRLEEQRYFLESEKEQMLDINERDYLKMREIEKRDEYDNTF